MPKSGNHNVNNIDSFFRVRPSKTNIREGETVSFLEDGVLVKQEKRNGVVYEQKFTELASSAKVTQTTGDVTNLIVTGSSSSEGDVTGITAGTGLSGGGSGGNITLNIDSTVTTLTGTQTLTNKTLTAPTLTTPALGTPASGVMTNVTGTAANLTVGNATKITSITNSNIVQLTSSQTLTNKTLTSPVINTGISGSAILDSDTMSGVSATTLSSSESIKAYVDTEVAGIVSSAPSTLDTLNELAAALGNDENFSTTVTNSIATKAVLTGSTNNQITTVTGANAIQGESGLTYNGSTLGVTGEIDVSDIIHLNGNASNRLDLGDDSDSASSSQVTLAGVNNVNILIDNTNNGTGDFQVRARPTTANDLDTASMILDMDKVTAVFNQDTSQQFQIGSANRLKILETGVYVQGGSLGVGIAPVADNGLLQVANAIICGDNDGNVALTTNDGGGNAQITFNHTNQDPDNNGQSGRIHVNVDATSSEGEMVFETSSSDVTGGATDVALVDSLKIAHDYIEVPNIIRHMGDTHTNITFTGDAITLNAGGETLLTLTESSQDVVKLGDGGDVDINLNDDMFVSGASGNVGINQGNKLYFDGINVDDVGQNTYIQSDTADNLKFVVGNRNMIEMIEDDSQDMVVIGNGATDVDFIVEDDAGAAVLTVDSQTSKTTLHSLDVTNNVGLGDVTADNVASNSFHYNNSGSLGAEAFTIGATGGVNFTQAIALANADFSAASSDGAVLNLKTTLTSEDAVDILGRINFSAPVSGNAGDDSRLLAASIVAQKSAVFSSTSNQTDLIFQTGTSETATEKVRIKNDGKVGIGTTSPSAKLEISNDAGHAQNTILVIKSDDPNGDHGASSTADIDFHIWDSNTRLSTPQARIGVVGDGTGDQNYEAGGQLAFYTNVRSYGSPVITERMRIDSSGNVGIGTNSPDTLLHLNEDDSAVAFKVTGGSGGAKIASFVRDVGVSSPYAETYIHAGGADPQVTFRSSANQYFSMGIDLSASSFKISEHTGVGTNDRLTIDTSGNVGIGQTSPTRPLHIGTTTTNGEAIRLDGNASYGATISYSRGGSYNWNAGVGGASSSASNIPSSFWGVEDVSQSNAVRLVIAHTTGNVGIGTTSPAHEMVLRKDQAAETELSIVNLTSNSSAKTNLRFRNATSGSETGNGGLIQLTNGNDFKILNQFGNNLILGTSNAEKMRISSAGNVGIGELSPDRKLHITGSENELMCLESTDTNTDLIFADTGGSVRVRGASGNFDVYTGGTASSTSASGSTYAFRIESDGDFRLRTPEDKRVYIGDGNEFSIRHSSAGYNLFDSSHGAFYLRNTISNQNIYFGINDDGTTAYPMTIHGASQNIGIGTTSPAYKLDVNGTARFQSSVRFPDSIGATFGDSGDLQIFHNGSYGNITNGTGNLYIDNTTDNADMYFRVDDAGTLFTAMRIDGSEIGNVHLPNDGQNLYIGENNDIRLVHLSGTNYMYTYNGPLYMGAVTSDQDVFIRGNDGGASINAVQFDMSDAGTAIFNHDIVFGDGGRAKFGASADFQIVHDSNINFIHSTISDRDIYVRVNDGGSSVDAIIIDASDAGTATFSHDIRLNTELGAIRFGASQQGSIYEHASDIVISNSAAGNDTIFENLNSAGSEYVKNLFIDGSTSRIGIGTTSPASAKLHVLGDNNDPGLRIQRGNSTGQNLYFRGYQMYNAGNNLLISASNGNQLRLGHLSSESELVIDSSGKVLIGGTSASGHGFNLEVLNDHAYVKGPDGWNGAGDKAIVALGSAVSNESFGCGYVYGTGLVLSTYKSSGGGHFGSSTQNSLIIADTTGKADFINDVVAYASSDKRLKENIKPLDNALDKIEKINGVEFDWIDGKDEHGNSVHGNEGHDVGVIAQEIEEVLPEVVTTRDNGYKAVKYEKIVPLLIEAIKEQQVQIDELKTKIGEQNG